MKSIWILAALALFPPYAIAARTVAVISPHYVNKVPVDDPSRTVYYYLKGENSEVWTERLEQQSQPANGRSLDQLVNEWAEQNEKECSHFDINVFPSSAEGGAESRFLMWHCGRRTGPEFGDAGVVKFIHDGKTVHSLRALTRSGPFEKAATPLGEGHIKRWAVVRDFDLCVTPLQPACWPDINLLMTTEARLQNDEKKAEVSVIVDRALEIRKQDRLAWRATDELSQELKGEKADGEMGWVAIPTGETAGDVYFLKKKKGKVAAMWVTHRDEDGMMTTRKGTAEDVTDGVKTRFIAIRTAANEVEKQCTATMNTVIMQHEDGKSWLVYFLAADNDLNHIWIGGHHRFHISESGEDVFLHELSAKSCLMFPDKEQNGKQVASLAMTHLISDIPWETQVFQSLQYNKPMIVGTSTSLWRIRDGALEQMPFELD